MKKILLDTSAYSRLCQGSEEVLDALSHADLVHLSVFVLGELYAGFKGGSKEAANRDLLERFLRRTTVRVVTATKETAEVFAEIKHALKKAGTPLPLNDIWIAAHAVETGSVLVTYDAHFRQIAGLRLWDPCPDSRTLPRVYAYTLPRGVPPLSGTASGPDRSRLPLGRIPAGRGLLRAALPGSGGIGKAPLTMVFPRWRPDQVPSVECAAVTLNFLPRKLPNA